MRGIARALALTTTEQLFRLLLSFVQLAVISRLLSPAEIGVSVVGAASMALLMGLREFASSNVLIQHAEVADEDARTSFTILVALTATLAAAAFCLAPAASRFYGEADLATYIRIAAIAALCDPLSMVLTALLRRDMAFGSLFAANVTASLAGLAVAIGLAAAGFGSLSIAYAGLAVSGVTAAALFLLRPCMFLFRPCLRRWSSVVSFGGYSGATLAVTKAYETIPQIVLGRVLSLEGLSLLNRAGVVCNIPDRLILSSIFMVAYPAIAAEVRQGRELKAPYLRALGHITAIHWPALVTLGLLAGPVVQVTLGQQWGRVVPIVQILALANLTWFPGVLTNPLLTAVGAIRETLRLALLTLPFSAALLCVAGSFGIEAAAWSACLTFSMQSLVGLSFVRRYVHFGWMEVVAAVWRSAVVALCTGTGALVALKSAGESHPLLILTVAAALCIPLWFGALRLVRHPLLEDLRTATRGLLPAGAPAALRLGRG